MYVKEKYRVFELCFEDYDYITQPLLYVIAHKLNTTSGCIVNSVSPERNTITVQIEEFVSINGLSESVRNLSIDRST